MSENLTPEQLAHRFKLAAEELVAHAERKGVCLTITREPLQPLAIGHARHVVDARPARQQPAPTRASVFRYLDEQVHKDMAGFYEALGRTQPLPPKVITGSTPRPISDRDWAAQPANLREGCTVHVPGVGDL